MKIFIEVEDRTATFVLTDEIAQHFVAGGSVDIRIGGYDADTKQTLIVNACKAEGAQK